MKIVIVARCRNEAPHIDRFVENYLWADKILIADGGSEDGSLELWDNHKPFVEVRPFTERVRKGNTDVWRNPEGRHVNFVLDWAYSITEPDDWVLLDEPDSSPNREMRKLAREVLSNTDADYAFMKRMYLWGTDMWFPQLTPVDDNRYFGIWGARKRTDFHWEEKDPFIAAGLLPSDYALLNKVDIDYPAALLHYFTLTPERAEAKLKFYRESGQFPDHVHWLENCGPVEDLPEWAHL